MARTTGWSIRLSNYCGANKNSNDGGQLNADSFQAYSWPCFCQKYLVGVSDLLHSVHRGYAGESNLQPVYLSCQYIISALFVPFF